MSKANTHACGEGRVIRVAIYTRKSTEEGLQQDFNTLDAQRESAEAYIAAQKHEGWICLVDRYDDGGFTGANLDRPAVQRMMKDIEAGKIDCVTVYKVDRLSRSLMDFARLMQTFEKHSVSFVSVTQAFNTTHSMGRLMLNVLLSFAQFEREVISERTRDKIAAARRKGKWSGGHPLLGYDVLQAPGGSKLVVNENEAARVRAIFEMFLEHEKLLPVVQELQRRRWTTKSWVTRKQRQRGGRPFDKVALFRLLTNPVYRGKVKYRTELHPGEHAAIVDELLWQRAQGLLQRNGRSGGGVVRNKYGALLSGLIRCAPCDAAMVHTYTSKGQRRYRYYTCLHAQKRGWNSCPSKAVPAVEIERFVIEQIRAMGRDPALLAETVRQVQAKAEQGLANLQAEEKALQRELARDHGRLQKLAVGPQTDGAVTELAAIQERMASAQQRQSALRNEVAALNREVVREDEVVAALASFDPMWATLSPREQSRIFRLLVERVDFDGKNETVTMMFRPCGIKALAHQHEEVAA